MVCDWLWWLPIFKCDYWSAYSNASMYAVDVCYCMSTFFYPRPNTRQNKNSTNSLVYYVLWFSARKLINKCFLSRAPWGQPVSAGNLQTVEAVFSCKISASVMPLQTDYITHHPRHKSLNLVLQWCSKVLLCPDRWSAAIAGFSNAEINGGCVSSLKTTLTLHDCGAFRTQLLQMVPEHPQGRRVKMRDAEHNPYWWHNRTQISLSNEDSRLHAFCTHKQNCRRARQ